MRVTCEQFGTDLMIEPLNNVITPHQECNTCISRLIPALGLKDLSETDKPFGLLTNCDSIWTGSGFSETESSQSNNHSNITEKNHDGEYYLRDVLGIKRLSSSLSSSFKASIAFLFAVRKVLLQLVEAVLFLVLVVFLWRQRVESNAI